MLINSTISLGIDYSYEEIGFCVSQGSMILHLSCLNFKEIERKIKKQKEAKKIEPLTKDQKRTLITNWIKAICDKYSVTCVIVEQIRIFSRGFISLPAIIAFAQLILTIRNAAKPIPVFEVDTRVWKKRILGSAKAQKGKEKEAVLKWIQQYMTNELQEKRNNKEVTHNEADAGALSFFARHPDAEEFLKGEG